MTWQMTWQTTYPDLLTICAEAPSAAHRAYALRLLALECTRRLDSMSPGYRLRGPRKNLVYEHAAATASLRLSDIIEGRPLGGMLSAGPWHARAYLQSAGSGRPGQPLVHGYTWSGPPDGRRYSIVDILDNAATLKALAIADMGAQTFADARAEWLNRLLAARGPNVAGRYT